jgi:hypothetical protein
MATGDYYSSTASSFTTTGNNYYVTYTAATTATSSGTTSMDWASSSSTTGWYISNTDGTHQYHQAQVNRVVADVENYIAKPRRDTEAEKKAKELLKSIIGEEQFNIYEQTGRVLVKGRKGKYIVRKNMTVQHIKKDKLIDLCVHIESKHRCPPTDHVIALMMLLESEEKYVLKTANVVGKESRPAELPLAACM